MKKLIYIVVVLGVLLGCSEPPREPEESFDSFMKLSDDQLAFNGIETGKLEKGPVYHKVAATGRVDVPPNFSVQVSVPLDAYVVKINVLPGHQVDKGQVLAIVKHPGIAEVQQNYVAAKADLDYARDDLMRKKDLIEGNAVSIREYQQVQNKVTSLRARLSSLESELAMLGLQSSSVVEGEISGFLELRAPISGVVTRLYGGVGELVSASGPLVSLLNRDHEHIELNVFQQDFMKIKKGMKVFMNMPGDSNTYQGVVFLINDELDTRTGAANIHVHPQEGFPDLPVNSVVFAKILYQIDTVYRLNRSEVIREEENRYLFIKTDRGFEKKKVDVGMDDGEYIQILGPNELLESEVVVKGNYYLNGS